jgi:type I restriction enzyme S subunit
VEIFDGPFGSHLKTSDYVDTGVRVIRLENIGHGHFIDEKRAFISEEKYDDIRKHTVVPGDIVLSSFVIGSIRSALVPIRIPFAVNKADCFCIRFSGRTTNPTFIQFFLQSHSAFKQVERMIHGVGRPRINTSQLKELIVPIAPIREQARIIAKIEALFTELDQGVKALASAQRQLGAHRRSVLKHAFEGKLTACWRDLNRNKIEPITSLVARVACPSRPNRWNSRTKDVILGHPALAVGNPGTALPDGWTWCQLADIARMESGHTPSREHPEWWGGDVPWIGIADAREYDGRVIKDTLQHTNQEGLAHSAARLLPAGTVCISRTASVGYVVVMGREMATSQDFVTWTPTEAVTSDWLRIIFGADKESLRRFGKGSVHKTIYFPEWLSVHVALPPLAEQKEIASQVDDHLSSIDHQVAVIEEALQKADVVKQAILKHAFAGQLVSQDPRDEPATLVLDRICAERQGVTTRKRRAIKNRKKKAA